LMTVETRYFADQHLTLQRQLEYAKKENED
jgi:hypothetical protein